MKSATFISALSVVAILLVPLDTAIYGAPLAKRSVLILFSDQQDLLINEIVDTAIANVFLKETEFRVELYHEYMDLARFTTEVHEKALLESYKTKYNIQTIDLIILTSLPALEFVLKYRQQFLPGVPVVFINIPKEWLDTHGLPREVTGTFVVVEDSKSVEWVLKARPSTKEIVLIYGKGQRDIAAQRSAKKLVEDMQGRVRFTDLSDLPLADINKRVAILPKRSVIFYTNMFNDVTGAGYVPREVLRELAEVSSVPIVSSFDSYIGTGTVGGYMISFEKHGKRAAEIALQILRGSPVGGVPDSAKRGEAFIFDHKELIRWGIPLSALPPGSVLKNRQYSVWRIYRWQIIGTIVALLSQAILIVFLIGQTRRRGVAEGSLRQALSSLQIEEKKLKALHDVTATANRSLDLDMILQGVIQKIAEIFDFGAQIFLFDPQGKELRLKAEHNRPPETYSHPTLFRGGQDVIRQVIERGEALIFEDVQTDLRYAELDHSKAAKNGQFTFLAVFPVKSKARILGTIVCAGNNPRRLTSDEIALINSMADQIGIAVENIALYEATKEQAFALEKAVKVKDEFLSVMSHELRTPLSVILGYVGILKARILGEINPKQGEALGKVLHRAAEQLNMINDIMQTTQLEARAIGPEAHQVDLSEFLRHLRSDYEAIHDKAEVALLWDYPSEPVAIVTDSGKLRQILRNLTNNAVKFTNKGSVTVSMRLAENHKKKWVELKVADTGIGIPQDKLALIFDKFYQVDSSETRLYGGVGLGLYIVRQFTELLGGKVEVESEPKKGTTFTVRLPAEQ